MKNIVKLTAAAVIALGTAAAATSSAYAVAPNFPGAAVAKINGEGFRKCKSLGSSGYTAVARGILGDGGGGDRSSGFRNFQVRTCFETRAQCDRWIDRIDHKISQIEHLHFIRCKART
ncbi:MAG: hypothetical protein AAF423_12755 [Pseudomonadota bacterium]